MDFCERQRRFDVAATNNRPKRSPAETECRATKLFVKL